MTKRALTLYFFSIQSLMILFTPSLFAGAFDHVSIPLHLNGIPIQGLHSVMTEAEQSALQRNLWEAIAKNYSFLRYLEKEDLENIFNCYVEVREAEGKIMAVAFLKIEGQTDPIVSRIGAEVSVAPKQRDSRIWRSYENSLDLGGGLILPVRPEERNVTFPTERQNGLDDPVALLIQRIQGQNSPNWETIGAVVSTAIGENLQFNKTLDPSGLKQILLNLHPRLALGLALAKADESSNGKPDVNVEQATLIIQRAAADADRAIKERNAQLISSSMEMQEELKRLSQQRDAALLDIERIQNEKSMLSEDFSNAKRLLVEQREKDKSEFAQRTQQQESAFRKRREELTQQIEALEAAKGQIIQYMEEIFAGNRSGFYNMADELHNEQALQNCGMSAHVIQSLRSSLTASVRSSFQAMISLNEQRFEDSGVSIDIDFEVHGCSRGNLLWNTYTLDIMFLAKVTTPSNYGGTINRDVRLTFNSKRGVVSYDPKKIDVEEFVSLISEKAKRASDEELNLPRTTWLPRIAQALAHQMMDGNCTDLDTIVRQIANSKFLRVPVTD